MGELRIMGRGGDEKVTWDVSDEDSVHRARLRVDEALKRNCLLFRQLPDGSQGERIMAFDEHAERVIIVPQMAGGAD